MRANTIPILAVVWSASMMGQTPAANDWVIVPGVRVGPITAESVPDDIRRLFPKDAVEDDEIELDEGMLQPATLVFKKNLSEALAISWNALTSPCGTCHWFSAGSRLGIFSQ